MNRPLAVIKVGGSLYDLPNLATRLQHWLAAEWSSEDGVLLIPGGGPVVDRVRDLDNRHRLGEEASHWLALRALTVNAYFLASLLPSACVIDELSRLSPVWDEGNIPILNVYEFAFRDENHPDHLPHTWAVTSDAVAARVAVVSQARHLVLLKSTSVPDGADWTEAGRLGLVDAMFAEVLSQATADLQVRIVNLRLNG